MTAADSEPARSGGSVERDACDVRVLLFSSLREAVGRASLELSMPRNACVSDLLDELGRRYAAVAAHRPVVRVAVNERYTTEDERLASGDEVALITPVSGG